MNMKITTGLVFSHKVFRKLNLNKLGGYCVYLLNKNFNKPGKAIINRDDYGNFLNSIHEDVKSSSLCENEIIAPTCDLQIIMPVYNTGEFLRESINSVLSQNTKYKYHLVIINDGSTDCSGDIIADYKDDPRVTIIQQANRGLSGARNAGLKKIFGRYLTFIDSDDILAPNAIANWLDAAYKYDADIVEGGFQRRSSDGKLLGGVKRDKESIADKNKMQGVAWLKIYKAYIWKNLQFPERYWYEDTIICGLITPMINVYVQIPDYVYYYTLNNNSISFSSRGKVKMLDNIYISSAVLYDACKLGYIKGNYEYYYRFFLYQTHTNWDRTYLLGPDIEYAVFKELCRLFNKYFPKDLHETIGSNHLVKALRNNDFNLYRLSNLIDF